MKALSKPLSSPGRSDKFPPPLLRFLRSNVSSRSRGRSRSSPMFYMRTRKNASALISTTQEPSSPKVTCIGQVRVRRAAKSTAKKTAAVKRRRCCWWWLRRPRVWGKIRLRSRRIPFWKMFRKWCLFFRFCYCNKKIDATEDSFRDNSNQKSEVNEISVAEIRNCSSSSSSNQSENNYRGEENGKEFLEPSPCSSPPKNALMLTRCRSAPYRSSSLAGRFWGSEKEAENEVKLEELEEKPKISDEISKELEKTVNNVEELQETAGNALHPLVLTRCKSEPARTGERLLNAEANLLLQTRLDIVEPCSQ